LTARGFGRNGDVRATDRAVDSSLSPDSLAGEAESVSQPLSVESESSALDKQDLRLKYYSKIRPFASPGIAIGPRVEIGRTKIY